MPIASDFSIDYPNKRITFSTAFVNDRPPSIYTVNELYSYLQDTFDEPAQMDDPIPMSAQTPTQYTLINGWFLDDNSAKALYGGSIQTSGWVKSGASGITQLRWQNAPADAPVAGDIGVVLTGGTSTATGILLAVNATRQVAWVRNTSSAQFANNEAVTGTGVSFSTATISGFQTGETIWANLFSVGSLQSNSEIYVGQEDDYQGGRAYHTSSTHQRRMEKIDEWWDSDVNFFAGSPNSLGGAGHFDILVKVREAGAFIDSGRLAVFARQFSKVYSHFTLTAGVAGNFVVPFASTGSDLNNADGPYTVAFDGRTGNTLEVGDVLENVAGPGNNNIVGRLRAVVTAVTGGASATGTIEYYLIGENEPLTTTNRTLVQLADNDDLKVRGDTTDFDVNGTPTAVALGPAVTQSITVTFGDFQTDVDEDSLMEEYGAVIDCNNVALADVYKRLMFLTTQGNQDGTVANTQDTLLPSAVSGTNEAGEFYRALGDVIIPYDGGIGTQITEGNYVANSGLTASGVVVSVTAGTTGVLVLTQVKGTFSDNDQIARLTEHATNRVVAFGTPITIAANSAAPFGTFAGGRFFFARGVVPTNVPAADANNWETTDLAGFRRAPPTVRTITFAGLVANDRAFLAEVTAPGGSTIRKNQNGVGAAGASPEDTTIPLDSTVALDVPSTGWVRVVDFSDTNGAEYRFDYSAVSGTTITLRPVSPGDDICNAGGSATVLVDTGIATNFGLDGSPKVGMMVINTDTGGWATVKRKIDNDTIETTTLSTGTWATGEGYLLNVVVVALVDADTIYFPYIDDTATSTSIAKSVKYVESTDLLARVRFSSPDVGGSRIQPFEQLGITLTDANLTVTAIRTADTIASV
jgi:hypothetical protein